ncbi:MAG: ferrous iron transporter B, partial [Clostridia bacterium]|nr:ferrous iron transporter B [Clostridia bacterium]
MSGRIIALAGNPNVGKSTVFNGLTGLHQHTGNWPGKTVEVASGHFTTASGDWTLVDIPGTYSLFARSAEEEVARDFLCGGEADGVIVVCDATCLERSLALVLQVAALEPVRPVVVCVNLMDEARRRGFKIDIDALSAALGLPVVGISARKKADLRRLTDALDAAFSAPPLPRETGDPDPEATIRRAEAIARSAVCAPAPTLSRLDRILTGRLTALPVMLVLLALVFWLTIEGANYPSAWLAAGFSWAEGRLAALFDLLRAPAWLSGALVEGVWRTLGWVVSVMLPPMAIFFPLFTLLEDMGYLPRVAYNLDRPFHACRACGKQALCMCMGLGCNAAGVVGCRIIDSPRERLLGILTNSFIPCNGRFPTMIALIAMFFVSGSGAAASLGSALLLSGLILLGILATFGVTWLLSHTLLRGMPSSFTLELPPYRRPQPGRIILRSMLDRTLFVLGRAAAVAAPAGLVLWLMANITVGEASLLAHTAAALDPIGRLLGLDGVILAAFLLGLPANEIVLPIALMAYTAGGSLGEIAELSALRPLLVANGWDGGTA